jgi:hypothetical protein
MDLRTLIPDTQDQRADDDRCVDDSEEAGSSGILAIQLNRSRPMKVQVKVVQLRRR